MKEVIQNPVKKEVLRRLFPDAVWFGQAPDEFSSVCDDSRHVLPGSIFIAIVGYETDGHLFAKNALDAGASLIAVQKNHIDRNPKILESVSNAPLLIVSDTRSAASFVAAEFYDHPSRKIRVHGITGTKGKTTSVHILADILSYAGLRCGMIGTLGLEFEGETVNIGLTTPGPIDFQHLLAMLAASGATDVACEVSAHAGALSRTKSVRFETVTYLNLSRDHGDHFTPEAYLDAKLAIARDAVKINPDVFGVANILDPHGVKFLEPILVDKRIAFGVFEENQNTDKTACDLKVKITGRSSNGLDFKIITKNPEQAAMLPLLGRFNAENAAASIAIADAIGIDSDLVVTALENVKPVSGRLEKVDLGQDFLVVVDYAHAPKPAEEALSVLRSLTSGRLIAVMGAGGSRDRGKRPMIGEVLARMCDLAIITSDNPRKEEPLDIINDILVGVKRAQDKKAETVVEADRKKAIQTAIKRAHAGDTVAILGKGHETYQIFKDETIHFDDREIAAEILKELGWGGVE
ncbi:MAG: UDP-N-acetylmuramoyl-L-alanyl-D-glutamate--2,6-diaminopimelate ligase [bacterium]